MNHRSARARRFLRSFLYASALLAPLTAGCGALPFFGGAAQSPSSPTPGSPGPAGGSSPRNYAELAAVLRQATARPGDVRLRQARVTALLEASIELAWTRRLDPAAASVGEQSLAAALAEVAPGTAAADGVGAIIQGDLLVLGEPAVAADAAAAFARALLGGDLVAAAQRAGEDVSLEPYRALALLLCADPWVADLTDVGQVRARLTECGLAATAPGRAGPDTEADGGAGEGSGADEESGAGEGSGGGEGSGAGVLRAQRQASALALLAEPPPELAGYVHLAARVAQAPAAGSPEASLLPPLGAHLRARSVVSVPVALLPSFWSADVRLDVPVARMPDQGIDGLAATLAERVLLVRSDGFSLLPRPLVRLEGTPAAVRAVLDDAASGWSPLATPQVRFDGPGALAQADLVDERVPAIAERLAALEAHLASAAGLPGGAPGGPDAGSPVSVLADGGVYVSTLLTLLQTVRDAGFSSVHLHGRSREGDLRTFPLRLADDLLAPAHTLVVRADGYSLTPYDPTSLAGPTGFLRTSRSCLLELVRHVEESLAAGTLDPSLPIRVRIDDGSLDVGLLVHLLAAVTWRRELDGVTTDLELAQAPARARAGAPVALHPAGIELAP